MVLRVSDPPRKLRIRIARANNTSYLAETDGEVIGLSQVLDTEIRGLTDGADPPTTIVGLAHTGGASGHSSYAAGFSFQVTKGNYWKVTNCSIVFWLPES